MAQIQELVRRLFVKKVTFVFLKSHKYWFPSLPMHLAGKSSCPDESISALFPFGNAFFRLGGIIFPDQRIWQAKPSPNVKQASQQIHLRGL